MRLICPNASSSPNVIIMASKVKRFISLSAFLFLFVGQIAPQVKAGDPPFINDQVVAIKPPFELRLKRAGTIRLAGLLFDEKFVALKDFVNPEDRIRLRLLSDKPDRYGRKAAQVYLSDGRWLQGELVRHNLAIPYPYSGEEALIRDLYLLENPNSLSALSQDLPRESFAIITGQVIDVAQIKGKTYLNFGANWRTDFTVRLNKEAQKNFRAFSLDPPTLKGKKIRIRGWVFEENGPMIAPLYPAQIEILEN